MSNHHIPYGSEYEIDYAREAQVRRTEQALKQIDPGDVLSVIDSRIASEADPKAHPLYHLVAWHLDKCLTPLDGAAFFNRWRTLVIEAINTVLDETLERGDN